MLVNSTKITITSIVVAFCLLATTSLALKNTNEPLFYNHIALEGGGSKAISYIGALIALKENGYFRDGRYQFEKIGGTSAGCFVGLLISLDIKPAKIEELIYRIDIFQNTINFDANLIDDRTLVDSENRTFLNISFAWLRAVLDAFDVITKARDILELWLKNDSPGLSDEQIFVNFLNNVILPLSPYKKQINDISTLKFKELLMTTRHDLHCFATQINDKILYEYSAHHTANEKVIKAVYASMSLPGVFKPLNDGYGNTLVDGGLLYNFPITMNDVGTKFDRHTLGLSLGKKFTFEQSLAQQHDEAKVFESKFEFSNISTLDYVEALYCVLLNREMMQYSSDPNNDERIVYLDSPIKTLDMNVESTLKSLAISKAYMITMSFLSKRQDKST